MAEFALHIQTDPAQQVARLRLATADGSHLATDAISLPEHSTALWEGLFDTRRYVERYDGALVFADQTEPETAASLLARLGRFLGETVLGPAILGHLTGPERTVLVVHLPTPDTDVLAAAFARVPWEIACLADGSRPRNLVVRAVHAPAGPVPATTTPVAPDPPPAPPPGETLRVLCVFAEAPGSRPLAMRLERVALRRLFAERILPGRRVEIDRLCHGVTRRRLTDAIRARRGYHLVHWSGHGLHNCLELQGEPDNRISGPALVELFAQAGGFLPRVFFLSACHSGALLAARDWPTLAAALTRDARPAAADANPNPRQLADAFRDPSGYTGTALALLAAGVPQVVAMRYTVGDDYARRLALAFYGHLFADGAPAAVDEALALARADLADDPEQAAYHAVDHATPLLFGRPGVALAPAPGRSPQLDRLDPRPWPLLPGGRRELDPPAVFVGRGEALARLGATWLAAGPATADRPTAAPAVALVQGLAGLGKTSLAAEAIHLYHDRFDLVLAFQAKPAALGLDDLLRQLDARLALESPVYRAACEANPLRAVALAPDPARFGAPGQRQARQRENLLAVLRAEAILLVIDNFETNLEPIATGAGGSAQPGAHQYACADPDWDALLADLAAALPMTRSRLLVTSRHRLWALADPAQVLWPPLGPLPMAEAGLYLRSHPKLRPLLFGDPAAQRLALRLLQVSRGHPLILDRLAALATDPAALTAALDRLQTEGWRRLPDLFDGAGAADDAGREAERAYLEDVAIGAVDLLIERLTPDARRLLRVLTLATEPVAEDLLDGVWQGRAVEDPELDRLEVWLEQADHLPDDDPRKQQVAAVLATAEGQQLGERLRQRQTAATRPPAPPIAALLAELRESGLLNREDQPEGPPTWAFHELVRERMAAWRGSDAAEADPDTPDDDAIRIGYGERYARRFKNLYHQDRALAAEAGRRALGYFVAARAFDRLGDFASMLVTGITDPTLLRGLFGLLQGALEQAPPGRTRWSLRTWLADALRAAGQPERAQPLYAAAGAEAAGHWADLAWITANWAIALVMSGDPDRARALHLQSAAAGRRAGRPEVNALMSELEALRIDIIRGDATAALPEIEPRLARIRGWWQRTGVGERVPEAPDRTFLGRALVGALNIAWQANLTLERWEPCIDLLTETEEAANALGEGPVEQAMPQFNRYGPLIALGRLDEAQQVIEACLPVYRAAGVVAYEAACLSALANVWDKRGDLDQAVALARQALAVRNRLPDPRDRAISHDNLGNYLKWQGHTDEAARHQAAALAYAIATGEQHPVRMRNLRIDARRALAAGSRYQLPPLADLLAADAFAALREFLAARGLDPAAVQAELDCLLDAAHADPD